MKKDCLPAVWKLVLHTCDIILTCISCFSSFLFVGDSRGVLLFCIWMNCKYQQLVLAGRCLSETVGDGNVYNIPKA